METGKRPRSPDLTHLGRLEAEPWAHHLFHALRVIEAEDPDSGRLGQTARPAQDRVRIGQAAALSFPPSMLASFEPAGEGRPARLTNRMFGLFGPQGPLPLHLTEYARDRDRNFRDRTFVAFANMLTHRLASLFYRAWSAGQPSASFDNPASDEFGRKIDALTGRAGPALRDRDAMDDLAKRYFAGQLSARVTSARRLQAVLLAFLDAPVRLREFVGSWLTLEPDDCWHLGQSASLGRGAVLGRTVWSRAAKFRVRIGPLSLAQYLELLPGGTRLSAVRAVVRNAVGDSLDWDINLVLRAEEVPRLALDGSSPLGHASWLGTRRAWDRDADDLCLSPGLCAPPMSGRTKP